MNPLLSTLRDVVGTDHVLTDGDLSAWELDCRRRWRGKALAVVRPRTTAEVVAVVQACAAAGAPLVTQGGNTGIVHGSTPDDSGREVLLSTQRLNAVRQLDRANMAITVEAGCVLQAVQQAAEAEGLLFPLSLASEGSCTIGGNLATNAGGTQVLRFGNARDLCLGLEVVTARGEVWNGLSGLRKDNTGYDLRDLFVGSEGTLGIITAATLKLYPQPAAKLTAWAAVPSIRAAVELLELAYRHLGAALTSFECMEQYALHLGEKHFPQLRVPFYKDTPCCVLLENSDAESQAHARAAFEALLEEAMNKGCVTDAVVAESIAQAKALWHIRESLPLAQAMEGMNIKHDISLPVSQIADYCDTTGVLLQREIPGARLINFGHLGDGNLHYNIQEPPGMAPETFVAEHEKRVNQLVHDQVKRYGGSISAEHGIGALKVDTLPHYKQGVALEMMRAIKRALDPGNLFNPGRVVRI